MYQPNAVGGILPAAFFLDPPEILFAIRNTKQFAAQFAASSGKILSIKEGEEAIPDECPNCGGTGYVAKPVDLNGKSDGIAFIRLKCPACGGTGRRRPLPPSATG